MEGKDITGTYLSAGCVHVCESVVVGVCMMGM